MKDYIKEWEDSQEKIIRCKGVGQCDWSGVDCDEDSNCGEYEPGEIKIPLTDFLLQKIEDAYADGQNSILNKMKELGMDWEVDQVVEEMALKGE